MTIPKIRTGLLRGAVLAAAALSLGACVASEKPFLTEGKPILGQHFTAELFRGFSDGKSHELRTTTFRWQDGAYVNAGAGAGDVARFVTQTLQGDDSLIQSSDGGGKLFRYWIGRKLADGAYLIFPLDEADIDDAGRTKACAGNQPQGFCIVETPANLLTLAKAAASQPVKNGEIAVVVETGLATSDGPAVR